jgi:hypothetical protein
MVEETNFEGLKAVRIANDKGDELVVLTEVGPRIISFKPEGRDNFFYVNRDNFGKKVDFDQWSVYGGTRLWVSPEMRVTYAPDNAPVQVKTDTAGVTLTAPGGETGIRRIMRVEAKPRTFSITYAIVNEGPMLHSAGLWVLSCLEPAAGSRIYLPWGEEGEWNVKDMKYWRSWLEAGSDIESKQWKPTNEFFVIEPSGETGKVGFRNRHGFALFQRGDLSFIKKAEYIEESRYPDDGCSFEVYTSKDFYEIETLSPLYALKPGIAYSHREDWWAGHEKVDTRSISSVQAFLAETFS